MATISERLAYILTFDTTSGVKSLEKMGSTADKELGKVDKRLDKLGAGMQKFGAMSLAAAGVAGVGLFKLASGAADADANMAALRQVVGDVAATNIGKWAENSARGVGMASKEAVAASTQFAGLGKIIGLANEPLAQFAQQHVELAADMAAFKNVSPQQAVQDLSAAYAGSTEVLRKYNIFLDDRTLKEAYAAKTGEVVTGTLSTQQKIIAINAELYRQSADMAGQWGREAGELAGLQATLKAELTNLADEIGAGVLPHMVSMMSLATKAIGVFSSLDSATKGTVGSMATFGVGALAVAGSVSFVIGKLISMRESFGKLGAAAPKLATAMGVAGVALLGVAMYAQNVAQSTAAVTKRLDELSRASDDQILDQFNHALGTAKVLGRDVNDTIAELARTQLGAAERIIATAKAKGEETEYTRALETAIVAEKVARENVAASIDAEIAAVDDLTESTDTLSVSSQVYIDHAKGMQRETKRVADEAERASQRAIAAYDRLNNKLKDRSAYLDIEDAFAAVGAAAERAADTTDKSFAEQSEDARAHERTVIALKEQVASYAQGVADLPPEAATEIIALIDEDRLMEAAAKLQALERRRLIYFEPMVGRGNAPSRPGESAKWSHDGSIVGGRSFKGLRDDDVPMVLQKGQAVLTEGQQKAMLNASPAGETAAALGGGGGPIVLVIEGQPFTAMLAKHDQAQIAALRAGLR
jgi:hypothetical protein